MPVQFQYKDLDHQKQGMLYAWFAAMHTRIDMILCHKTEDELKDVAHQIEAELATLEKLASYYDKTSELYAVNQKAARHPVALSKALYAIIEAALQYRGRTWGCFDISIQSEGYHKDTWQNIKLLPDCSSVYFEQAGIRIDLSGLLKGYALDKTQQILHANGINDALISMGNSSVLGMGNHPYGKGWKVSFDGQAGTSAHDSVLLQDQCLTTSGNNTKERKHIISPQTGNYIEGQRQVAVVTAGGEVGEVLSTALFVATPEQWDAIIESFKEQLILIIK